MYPTRSSYRTIQSRIKSEINITPFVDVMLVLLLVFMILTPLMLNGIEVDLPQAATQKIHASNEPLTISIDKQKNIYITKTQVQITELAEKLQNIKNSKNENNIYIRGDKQVQYEDIMKLIEIVHNAGFTKIGLISEKN